VISLSVYFLEVEESCQHAIAKKCRKNKPLQNALSAKITQIRENPYAFKPLRAPLEGTRRVHVLSCFVLIYDVVEERKTVRLLKFAHHDEAYQ
jgi:YafQ family addiction module toxin component